MQNGARCTRREFGCAIGGVLLPRLATAAVKGPWDEPANVKRVYIAVPTPSWPRPDLDVQAERSGMEARLAELERKHAGAVRLTGGELLRTPEDAQAWVKALTADVDGVLLIDLTSGTGPMLKVLQQIQVPMLLFARPYSGWSYVEVTGWMRQGKKAAVLSTSEFGDLDPYMRIFRSIHHLRYSKVLLMRPGTSLPATADAFKKQYGTDIRLVDYQELKAAFDAADGRAARKAAEDFTRSALRVVEPKQPDIEASLRLHIGITNLLAKERANAIAIDCLGGFRRGDLPAYPCVSFSKLNDEGRYGVCEADLLSTMTQLLLTSFSGKPGFVSDPVFDTSRNEIIHAHCVSATALQGVGGPSAPYIVRTHMEDNKGVSMQVLVPIGDTVTCGKFLDATRFALSTGQVVGNVDDPRGCRTKFRTRVADAAKMLENFSGGLHRVVVFGDYTRAVQQMSRLMGFQVIQEC